MTSPSELVLADDCRLAHHYKYDLGLRPIEIKRSPTAASGTAVSYVVETWCREYGPGIPPKEDLDALAAECLEDEFANDDDGGAYNVKRYKPGVLRALQRIPTWVWQADWAVERDIYGEFEGPTPPCGECGGYGVVPVDDPNFDIVNVKCPECRGKRSAVTLHGRPDMYRFVKGDEVDYIEIVDLKTTDHSPLSYMLWTPQIRMYAAMLHQQYPEWPIVYIYLCVPTTNKNVKAPDPTRFVFTKQAYEETIADIQKLARGLSAPIQPRYARRCEWCDFATVCTTRITGGDTESFIADNFTTRQQREEVTSGPVDV